MALISFTLNIKQADFHVNRVPTPASLGVCLLQYTVFFSNWQLRRHCIALASSRVPA